MTASGHVAQRVLAALSGALAVLAIVLSPALARAAEAQPRSTGRPGSDWLGEINLYRAATGLPPVSDQPAWDQGLADHLAYLQSTPQAYFTGAYASFHTENPASPYYTPSGALEAGYSDLAGASPTPVDAIDGWLAAPFHAIGILRPKLAQVAFGMGSGHAGLDIIQGLDSGLPDAAPILFPGPGMTTDLLSFEGENPDPLETCGWQTQAGLPLIAMLAAAPDPALTADLTGPGGAIESSAAGTLCVVDQYTFRTSDGIYGPTGASILQSDRAVVLVPRAPLHNGAYVVTIHQPAQADLSWSFTVYVPPPANTAPPAIRGVAVNARTLSVDAGTWTEDPTAFAYRWLRCDGGGGACRAVPTAGRSRRPGPATASSPPTSARRSASRSRPATAEVRERPPCRLRARSSPRQSPRSRR